MKMFNKLFGGSEKKPDQMTAEYHTKLGYEHWKKGKANEAIMEYQEALRIDPNFALARSNLGFTYNEQGRLDDAIREWEETLRRGVPNVIIRGNTEDWLKKAKALRDERAKQIEDVDSAVSSYIKQLGQASTTWPVAHDALKRIGAPATGALTKAIESDNSLLRARSMDLLGKIGDQRAIEPLTKASKITEEEFRRITGITGATQTIMMGSTKIEVPLTDMLKEHREYAKTALKEIKKRTRSND